MSESKKNSVNPEEIKTVLTALFNFREGVNENNLFHSLTKNKDFLEELKDRSSFHSVKDFCFTYNYDFSVFTEEMYCDVLNISPNNHDLLFILTNYNFIEGHFKKLIEKAEGSACCADKSGFIMSSLINYYKDNKNIVVNYEQEYTYHLPKIIFNNQESILEFFDGVHRLYYSQVDKFVVAYHNVLKAIEINNAMTVENKNKQKI